jgi:hypothetical protein
MNSIVEISGFNFFCVADYYDITPCRPFQQTTRRYIPEGRTVHRNRCENPDSDYSNVFVVFFSPFSPIEGYFEVWKEGKRNMYIYLGQSGPNHSGHIRTARELFHFLK